MSVRETLNKHPRAVGAVAFLLAFACLAMVIRQGTSADNPGFMSKAFYTVDDGKTTFVDSFLKPYPFDHEGKPAFRAVMFRVGANPPFVAYLERYTEAGKAAVSPLLGSSNLGKQQQYNEIRDAELEVKRPGDKTWVKSGNAAAQRVTSVTPPTGQNGNVEMVLP